MNYFKKYHHFSLLLGQLLSLVVIFQTVSCACNKKSGGNRSGLIMMKVPSEPLEGENRSFDIIFDLTDTTKIADLDNFSLEATIKEEKGDIGNKISYAGLPQGATHIKGSVKNICSVNILTAANPSTKVGINFLPASKTTRLELQLRICNKAGDEISAATVTWIAAPRPAEISVNHVSSENIKGSTRAINIIIENQGGEDAEEGKTKLKIERKLGSAATIVGSVQTAGSTYMLDLPSVKANSKLSYELLLDLETTDDSKVVFDIQPQYNDVNIHKPFSITWERGAELKVISAKYDPKTNKITAVVKNIGTESATAGKVTVGVNQSKTPGAKIEGNSTVEIKKLKPGEEQTIDDLGTMDFGKKEGGQDNLTAVCNFGAFCAQSCPKAPQPTVEKVLIKSDIVLSLLPVAYNIDTKEVTMIVRNTGKDKAEGLQLKYKNVSSDQAGRLATLSSKQQDSIKLNDLGSHTDDTHIFKLDLNDADEASFKFKLIYDNNAIEERTEIFRDKPLNLTLEVITPSVNNIASYILYGAENELKLKINQASGGRSIKLEQLALSIEKASEGTASISQTIDGIAIHELKGNALGTLGSDIKLYLNPRSGEKEANFKIQLKYNDKVVGEPIWIEWREYPLMIITHGRLVGDQEGTFEVRADVPLDFNAIKATLKGDGKTTFYFIKNGHKSGTSATLAEIAEYYTAKNVYDVDKRRTTPIKFKVDEEGNQEESKLSIILTHGTTEIARQDVEWVKTGVGLEIKLEQPYMTNSSRLVISLHNTTGRTLNLQKTKIRLTNTEDIPFTLGNRSGAKVEETVASVGGLQTLEANHTMHLQTRPNVLFGDKLATGLKLAVLDEADKIISQACCIYLGGSIRIDNVLTPMMKEKEGNELFKQEINKRKDNLNSLIHFQLMLQKLRIAYAASINKLEEIKNNDADFEPIVTMLITTELADNLKKLETFERQTQETILQLNKNEKIILEWIEKEQKKIVAIKARVSNSPTEIEKLRTPAEINKFLVGDGTRAHEKNINKQHILTLYEAYVTTAKEAQVLLANYGIDKNTMVVTGGSEAIKKLLEMSNQMVNDAPTFQGNVQIAFDTGFTKFVGMVEKEQADSMKFGKKDIENRKADLYNSLQEQRKLLAIWIPLSNNRYDVIAGADQKLVTLAARYQRLAANILKFAKKTYSKKFTGDLKKADELSVEVANDAFQIAQISKTPRIQEITIKTHKLSINTHKLYEESRNAQGNWKKAKVILEESTGKLRLTPTVLQDLESQSKGLKTDLKELNKQLNKGKNKKGIFNRFRS